MLGKVRQYIAGFVTRKRKLSVFTGVIVILAGLLGWYYFGRAETAPVLATTVPVRKGPIEVKVSGTGSVKPAVTRSIMANVSGDITVINFTNGQQVKKGDLLFELNSDSLLADLKKAELDLQQAKLDYSLKAEEKNQKEVLAPISGQVEIIEVGKNDEVQKNALMMVINDTSKMVFKVPVNGGQLAGIRTGQKADVAIPSLLATLEGRVLRVDRGGTAGSDGSKLYDITVVLDNPGALTPGMEAQAVIHTLSGMEAGVELGPLEWIETVNIKAGVSGTVSQLYVDERAYVKKGQKLAYIDSETADTQLISQQLRLEQARLTLENLQKNLAECKIYAPVDGVASLGLLQTGSGGNSGSSNNSSSAAGSGQDSWQAGDRVSNGNLLGTVVSIGQMTVTVPVDEVDIAKIELGQKAVITVDALPEQTFNGSVSEIATEGTEQNNVASFDVTVSIDGSEGLKTNMTANVEIMVASKEGVLLLPIEAVQERQGRKFVLIPAGVGAGGGEGAGRGTEQAGTGQTAGGSERRERGQSNLPVNMKPVKTGLYNETMIEITSGLQAGDLVTLPAGSAGADSGGRQINGGVGGMRIITPSGGGSRPGGFGGGAR